MRLSDTSAIVTGGASGLGAATVRALADRGAFVVVADVQDEPGTKLAAEVGGAFQHVDVRDEDQLQAAVEQALAAAPLRSLVACAGVGWAQRTIGRDGELGSAHPLADFQRVIDINLVGTFNSLRVAATAMSRNTPDAEGQRGAAVFTASIAAQDGQIGQAAYAASKGGIVGLTLPAARDLSAAGIRVNTILPGLIDTPIYGEGPAAEEFKAKLGRDVLFPKRLGRPAEFASLAVELLTNDYLNAECIRIDAGIRLPPK